MKENLFYGKVFKVVYLISILKQERLIKGCMSE